MLTSATMADMVSFTDMEFPTAQVLCLGSAGTPYLRDVRYGVPKIPRSMLNCAVFLFGSESDAQNGINSRGSGFFVCIDSVLPDRNFCYVISNHHVAVAGGASVFRVPLIGGGFEVFTFGPEDWSFDPKYDIAVSPSVPLNGEKHVFSMVPLNMLLTEGVKNVAQIGPGDDVFMIGQFVDHNAAGVPSVRFGNISMDPSPIKQQSGRVANSFCIDMHSRSGYSGSPVFVYRTPGADLERMLDSGEQRILLAGVNHFSLLGIHWGQFPELWEVTAEGQLKTESDEQLLVGKTYVRGLSGMTCVLPAWAIMEVLSMPRLVVGRENANKLLQKEADAIPVAEIAATSEAVSPSTGDEVLSQMLKTPPKH